MTAQKRAPNNSTQKRKIFKYMVREGSINRYEAASIGVCSLPARVQDLEEKGLVYQWDDQNDIPDEHGILHNGIRRYFVDWENMTPEARAYFVGWIYD